MKSASPYCSIFGRWCALPASSMASACRPNWFCTRREKIVGRLEQADPDHMAGPLRPFAGFLDRDVARPAPAGIDARRDDALFLFGRRRDAEGGFRHGRLQDHAVTSPYNSNSRQRQPAWPSPG